MKKHFWPLTNVFPAHLGFVRDVGLLKASMFIMAALLISCAACASQEPLQNMPSPETAAGTRLPVSVDAKVPSTTIPTAAFGINTAVWDNNLLDPAVPGLLRKAGITLLRFPGGSTADVYHWKDHSITGGQGYINPNNTFDAYMGVVRQTGAQAFITVNYGSNEAGTNGGDPAEAAAWVYYANVVKHYGIKYWEIGNEVFGNGTYSSKWEADLHADKGPATYATNVLKFVSAMKAVDPSIEVGVVFTTPTTDGGKSQMADWNPTLLSIACSRIDFVDIHWYPQWQGQNTTLNPDAQLLASTSSVAGMIAQPRSEIAQYCGSHAKSVKIFMGEVNTGNSGRQSVSLVNALFLADLYMSWLEDGGSNVSWWDLHNGIDTKQNNSPSTYGTVNFGDQGVLSNGTCASGQCEPPVNAPFPPYYGLQMLTHLGIPGDQIVSTSSQLGSVAVHAVKQSNGNLAVLLINKDPSSSFRSEVTLSAYTPSPTATVFLFDKQSTGISSSSVKVTGFTFTQKLPPYSLTTIIFTPARAIIPFPVPLASQSTTSFAIYSLCTFCLPKKGRRSKRLFAYNKTYASSQYYFEVHI